MKHSRILFRTIPILLIVVLIAFPVFVVMDRMGLLRPAPTAETVPTAPEDAPELVFVADYDYDPYSYLNEDGTPNGLDVELACELANRLGMRPRIEFGTWSECKAKIRDREADVLLGLEIFVDGAATGTLKSIPVGSDTLSVIGPDAIDDAASLSGKRVGVSFGSALMGLFRLNCEYVEFFTYSEMFEAMQRGEIDYGICHASVACRLIEKNGYDFTPSLVLMESFPTMGIRGDEPELQERINRTLEEMSADGTITALRNKWVVNYIENRTVRDILNNYGDFFILYGIAAVILLAAYLIAIIQFRAAADRKKALEDTRKALAQEITRARDEKAYQMAILNSAYSYSRINLTQNRIIPPIIERENGKPVDYTDKFPQPLPSYEEVFAIGASRYVDDAYKESYVAYHNCKYLTDCYARGEFMPAYVCRIYSTVLGWHYRRYITYLSQDETSGDIFGMSVAYDITKEFEAAEKEKQYKLELEEARNAAESANRYKTNFLFSMSHDIRTPMNAILGFTNMAKKHLDDRAKVEDCLEKTLQSGNLLLSLINSVLDMSRIESGSAEPEESPADVLLSFSHIESSMREIAATKDIALSFDFGTVPDRYVYADSQRCIRILTNLISNAIKYTHEGGRVRVRCEQCAPQTDGAASYRYTVEDNGIGMSEDFQKHMFEVFTRERNSTTSGIQGTGLGLSVCKTFVEYMHGTIDCVSRLGEGTKFTVTLPFRTRSVDEGIGPDVGETVSGKARDDRSAAARLRGMRVLLVEDNELNREIAADLLDEAGLIVEEAEDGSVAVELLKEKGPACCDFILMDIQMPVMNGYEAARAIRAMYPDAKIPIIAVSANAFEEDRKASAAAGMDDHVAKPINTAELFGVLARFLQ